MVTFLKRFIIYNKVQLRLLKKLVDITTGIKDKKRTSNYTIWAVFDGLVKVLGLPITTSILYYIYERRQTYVKFLEEHSDEKYKKSLRNLLVFFHKNNCNTEQCVNKYIDWTYKKFKDVYEDLGPPNDPEFKEFMLVNESLTHIWDFSSRMHQIRNSTALSRRLSKNENMLGTTHLEVMSKIVCPIELKKPRDQAGNEFTFEMCYLFQRRFQSMENDWKAFMRQYSDIPDCYLTDVPIKYKDSYDKPYSIIHL